MVFVYPSEVRRPLVSNLTAIALDTQIICLQLTEYARGRLETKPRSVFQELKASIEAQKLAPANLEFVVESLRDAVETLSETLRSFSMIDLQQAIDFVVGRFDLFMGLAESGKEREETLKMTSIDLLSYLLINQILFYHIFSKISKSVDPLPTKIKSIRELEGYFKQITDINYRVIYAIQVSGLLPNTESIIERINQVIKGIHLVEPETIGHDLLGRLFHELLPPKTRKVLAAFYTKPVAAEILASLAIDAWDANIMDPACGSGTLAISAYRQKMREWQIRTGRTPGTSELESLHKRFVEQEITCLDIMPFAAHLTALNLSSQTISARTDFLRVGVMDSLDLAKHNLTKGINLSPFSATVQKTLTQHFRPIGVRSRGAVGANGKGQTFRIKKVDCVIMNPPFTDRKRLPLDFRNKLMNREQLGSLIKICGSSINLWGYFAALADNLLIPSGRVAAVIPMNLLRGKSTQKLRDYLLDNYTWHFVVVNLAEVGFSEAAIYRDILFVAQKAPPKAPSIVTIVFLKVPTEKISINEASELAQKILKFREQDGYNSEFFSIKCVTQKELQEKRKSIMPYVRLTEEQHRYVIDEFLNAVKDRAGLLLSHISEEQMIRGFEQSPKGLPQICFIARPLAKNRLKRAFMILVDDSEPLKVAVKGTKITLEIPRKAVIPALRSLTNVSKFDITGINDYIVHRPYKDWETVIPLTEWQGHFDWSIVESKLRNRIGALFIATRFRPISPNTHFLAFTCSQPFATTNKFTLLRTQDLEEAKIQSLFLNSVVGLANLLKYMSSATGAFIELKHYDLTLFPILEIQSLSESRRKSLILNFNKLSQVAFPSLLEQLRTRFWARMELDRAILDSLNFKQDEIERFLTKLYDVIGEELAKLKESSEEE
jgi:type I restriction-modification system DNA methylase subunit